MSLWGRSHPNHHGYYPASSRFTFFVVYIACVTCSCGCEMSVKVCTSMWKPEIKIQHLLLFHPILFFNLVMLSVCVDMCVLYCICGGMHAMVCGWRSGTKSMELVHSFHPRVASRDWTQVIRLGIVSQQVPLLIEPSCQLLLIFETGSFTEPETHLFTSAGQWTSVLDLSLAPLVLELQAHDAMPDFLHWCWVPQSWVLCVWSQSPLQFELFLLSPSGGFILV